MRCRQDNKPIFSLTLVRWLEVFALGISLVLYFMYLALAAGYEKSHPLELSRPGVNRFEIVAVLHLVAGSCYLVLVLLTCFRRVLLTSLVELGCLFLVTLMAIRIFEANLNPWPDWIGNYSRTLVTYSYIDFLMVPIILALWGFYFRFWAQLFQDSRENI